MARLARGLMDPAYEDGNPFVAKGRTMFAEAGGRMSDPAISREIGNLLGNDLGQMRVQFQLQDLYGRTPLPRRQLVSLDMGDSGQQQSDDQEVIHQAANLTLGEGGESTEMQQRSETARPAKPRASSSKRPSRTRRPPFKKRSRSPIATTSGII
jgi:hypothetical protein